MLSLPQKCANVLGVLGDFHLLDGLPQGGAVTGAVFADNADLLGTLGLEIKTGLIKDPSDGVNKSKEFRMAEI